MNRSHIDKHTCVRILAGSLLLSAGCFVSDSDERPFGQATSVGGSAGEDDGGATSGPGATSSDPSAGGDASDGSPGDDAASAEDGMASGTDDGMDDAATDGDTGEDGSDDGGSTGGPEPIEPVIPSDAIIALTFDGLPEGGYDGGDWAADWNSPPWENGLDDRVEIIADGHTGNAMRINHTQGAFGPNGGANWNTDLGDSYDTIYLGYWVRFSDGIDYRKGGTIAGMGGGQFPGDTSPPSLPDGTNGWSYKAQWRSNGIASSQFYHLDSNAMWGEERNWTNPAVRLFEDGEWHHVQHKVVMNTPGEADGSITGWFDGLEAFSDDGLRFRTTDALGIDALRFTNYFGGGDDSWSAVKPESVDFDDFVVSTEPILPGT